MNKRFKLTSIAFACTFSIALVACQKDNTHNSSTDTKSHHKPPHREQSNNLGSDAQHPQTVEQDKKHFQQRLKQYKIQRTAADKDCANKVNQSSSIQIENKTVEGKCLLTFQPDPPKEGNKHADESWLHPHPGPDVKDKNAFEQHHQLFQAQRKAFDQACVDRVGQRINIKFKEKIIPGKCSISFQPDHPPKMMPPPAQPAN